MPKYVDIAHSYTGTGHAGTQLDPYSFEDFETQIQSASADDYHLKGSRVLSSTTDLYRSSGSGRNRIKAWSPVLYGPWRIYGGTSYDVVFGSDVGTQTQPEGGIVDARRIHFGNWSYSMTYANMFLRTRSTTGLSFVIDGADADIYFKGCILISAQATTGYDIYAGGGGSRTITFQDCMLDGAVVYMSLHAGTTTVAVTNCSISAANQAAFRGANIDTWNETDVEYAWSPPTWPSWDAGEASWDYATLSAGISTPPQPGNDPYTGYQGGLWQKPRTGIGTGSFPDQTKYVDLDSSYTGTGHEGSDSDPYSFEDFTTRFGYFEPTRTWKLRGERETTSFYNFYVYGYQTVEAWDVGLYGPWRISGGADGVQSAIAFRSTRTNNNRNSVAVFRDGIVDSRNWGIYVLTRHEDSILPTGITLTRMWLTGPTLYMSNEASSPTSTSEYGSTIDIEKCTLIADDLQTGTNYGSGNPWYRVTISDSLLGWAEGFTDRGAGQGFQYVNLYRSYVSLASQEDLIPDSVNVVLENAENVRYNWEVPGPPYWAAEDLGQFDLESGYGVGYAGSWAQGAITRSPSVVVSPATVQFDVNMVGFPAVSYSWDFGDGYTSTLKSPSHTYNSPGVYTVSVTVTDSFGDTHTETRNAFVSVFGFKMFSSKMSGDVPLTVRLSLEEYILNGYQIDSYLWNAGDGSAEVMGPDSLVHTYSEVGTYQPRVTIGISAT